MRARVKYWAINVLIIVVVILFWQFILSNPDNIERINQTINHMIGINPEFSALSAFVLPQPSQILHAFLYERSGGRGGIPFFLNQGWITLSTALFGFLIGNLVAFITAALFYYFKPLERTFMPFALALTSVPLVALIPLLLRLRFSLEDLQIIKENPFLNSIFSTDFVITTIIVIVTVFFPTLVNTFKGIQSANKASLEFMDSINAPQWFVFWKLRLPSALPMIFSALKVTAVLSVGGAILSEWLSSDSGLGYIMAAASSSGMYNVYEMWVSLLITSLIAFGTYSFVTMFEKILIPWHESVIALKQAMNDA
jgi:NitT/TauT family transport system permease protein